jgi:pyruvate/2-oxoglutarate dehydrogenase complex dihydrolipoamide acyltransferase (E2) component
VTNVGMFGLPQGFAPLVPFSRAPIVLTVGTVEKRPRVVDDAVRIRPVLPIGATIDHRLLDGYQIGLIARRFREILEDPAHALSA